MAAAEITRTDDKIQHFVLDEVKWDACVQPNEISVAVKDGIVTLTGWVDSFIKKWAAEEAAHRVRGVKAVVDDIEVRLPTDAERTDEDIAAAAVRALEWDALIPPEQVVQRLAGARGVTNLITVRPKTKPSPDQLKKMIEDALVRSAHTDAKRITVEVQGDKVILRGTVRSWAERQEAERVTWSAPGVTSVENHITISL